jgi:hypothetical protein
MSKKGVTENHETYPDFEQSKPEEIRFQGRLRRVPGFLPVGLQDLLHSRQPEV